jgi:hypothetical protein
MKGGRSDKRKKRMTMRREGEEERKEERMTMRR